MKDSVLLGEQYLLPGLSIYQNGSLIISKMSLILAGSYKCTRISETDIHINNIVVEFLSDNEDAPCDISFSSTPEPLNAVQGNSGFLYCAVTEPDVGISWEINGTELYTYSNIRAQEVFAGALLLSALEPENSGTYSCVAARDNCTSRVHTMVTVYPNEDCGTVVVSNAKQIAYGQDAFLGSNPWQALLWKSKPYCGGSLITANWVITAAHCTYSYELFEPIELPASMLLIKLGKHDYNTSESTEQVIAVIRIIRHPEYTSSGINELDEDNDIALLHLEKPAHFTSYVRPICIADSNFYNKNIYKPGVVGRVSGWGLTEELNPSRTLQQINIPILNIDYCQAQLWNDVTDNMFCGGYNETGRGNFCRGDSGSPFAVLFNHRWYLAGVISWGQSCIFDGRFGVYTKVGNYYEWIQTTINDY